MPRAGDFYYFDSNKNGATYKTTVVLIHGAGGFHLHWPSKIRRLPGFRVLAIDLPGHGKSTGLGEHNIKLYAKKILKFLDNIGVGRAIFVGHSMGGAIVQSIAVDHPDYVLGAVLVGTGVKLPVNKALLKMVSNTAEFDAAMDLVTKWAYSKNADPKLIEEARKQKKSTRPSVVYGDYLACNQFNLLDRISEIKVPVLIIVGAEDKMTPPIYSKEIHKLLKNSSLKIIPGAGHMVMIEKEKEVARAMREFLEDHG